MKTKLPRAVQGRWISYEWNAHGQIVPISPQLYVTKSKWKSNLRLKAGVVCIKTFFLQLYFHFGAVGIKGKVMFLFSEFFYFHVVKLLQWSLFTLAKKLSWVLSTSLVNRSTGGPAGCATQSCIHEWPNNTQIPPARSSLWSPPWRPWITRKS